jgi:hypothetical protein
MLMSDEAATEVLTAAFFGHSDELRARITSNFRFAHYTSAETALRIIRGDGSDRSLWLRNATEMNDFSEVEYGQYLLYETLGKIDVVKRLKNINDIIGGDLTNNLFCAMDEERQRIKRDTFLLSLSEHDANDTVGLLSMWRAYGGSSNVCLLFNTDAFVSPQTAYDVDITAVDYDGHAGFIDRFNRILSGIEQNAAQLKLLDLDLLALNWKRALDDLVLSSKHPAFREEKEWRIIYRRKDSSVPPPPCKVVTVNGFVQTVFYLPMENVPDKGVSCATLNELLFKVIIGPSYNPDLSRDAFVSELENASVCNSNSRVVSCNIPLRR